MKGGFESVHSMFSVKLFLFINLDEKTFSNGNSNLRMQSDYMDEEINHQSKKIANNPSMTKANDMALRFLIL